MQLWNRYTSRFRWLIATLLIQTLLGCNPTEKVVQVLIPHHFFYSRADIQQRLNNRWHYEKKILGIFEVKIDTPTVVLLPETNRLRCVFNLMVRRPFSSHVARGTITVAGKLKFDPQTRSINLIDTEVETLNSEGLPANDPVLQTISGLFGGTLTDIKLYELKPEDLRYAGVTFDPVGFIVKSEGIDIELETHSQHQAE